jgi:hypothetical protein
MAKAVQSQMTKRAVAACLTSPRKRGEVNPLKLLSYAISSPMAVMAKRWIDIRRACWAPAGVAGLLG